MFFLLQKDKIGTDEVQNAIIQDVLHKYRYDHSFESISMEDFFRVSDTGFSLERIRKSPEDFDVRFRNAVPIGSVRFIELYLQIFKGIERDNAIEVPPFLRTDEFLKRKYSIVPLNKVPRQGVYFVKDATQQKAFCCKGELKYQLYDEMFQPGISDNDAAVRLDPVHLYQVSELVDILAEYRVYVLNREINSLCIFAGDPLLFPEPDLVRKAVEMINQIVPVPILWIL